MSNSLQTCGLHSPWNYAGQNTGVGSLSFLQGIFPAQRLNPGLSHCRWILDQLSYKGSPRIVEWVSYPFSSGSSQPRNLTGISCIAGRLFSNWVIRKASLVAWLGWLKQRHVASLSVWARLRKPGSGVINLLVKGMLLSEPFAIY